MASQLPQANYHKFRAASNTHLLSLRFHGSRTQEGVQLGPLLSVSPGGHRDHGRLGLRTHLRLSSQVHGLLAELGFLQMKDRGSQGPWY